MPFLRRRGVMASENDMRRHTTLIEPNANIATETSTPALTSESAASASASASTIRQNGEKSGNGETNGGGSSDLVGTSGSDAAAAATADVDAGGSNEARNGAGGIAGVRHSEDTFDRPESPPVQAETPKHHRFSMLKFRTASDSQLSARSRQHQQAEKPPPMPQRTLRAFPFLHLHLIYLQVSGIWYLVSGIKYLPLPDSFREVMGGSNQV